MDARFLLGCVCVLGVSVGPAAGQQTHRNIFSGRQTYWVPGDANVAVEEKDHRTAQDHTRSAPDAEYVKITAQPRPGVTDSEFAHYVYDTPQAPVNDQLTASVWVKAFRPGIQLRARVVLPNEADPQNPAAKLTVRLAGDSYDESHKWQRLSLKDPVKLLTAQKPLLAARLGREVNVADAYIDQLILNVYPGPGVTEVWIDDLDIGPVVTRSVSTVRTATPVGRDPKASAARAVTVEASDGQVLINGKPVFMRAIRHTDTPLDKLREAMFNTVWFPGDASPERIEEAVRNGFYVVPSVPLVSSGFDPANPNANRAANEQDAAALAEYFHTFLSRDWVLMWDLGTARTAEQVGRVKRIADLIRDYDTRRPRAADVWDGYRIYSNYLDAVGTHRFPLFTSLELNRYADFLDQRKALTGPGKLLWTWIQTHPPEWMTAGTLPPVKPDAVADPIGPRPEQIRLLTYLAVASGYRGLGFWSDRYLAASHQGQARLLQLSILNAELEMLEPVLLAARESPRPEWVATNHPHVKAAIVRGEKHLLVLPVWQGPGSQYCPDLAAVGGLKVKVPAVPTGADPWQLTAASVTPLHAELVPGGTEVTIPDFDLTAAVVFTADLQSMLVRWQDHTRHVRGAQAASWAVALAVEEFNTTLQVHEKLTGVAPEVPNAAQYFEESKRRVKQAEKYRDNGQYDHAYREATRALQPLRLLRREHWKRAVGSLDTPTATPYSVSYDTLPQFYELARDVQRAKPGKNLLPHGGFELGGTLPPGGADVTSLPGWTVRSGALDAVTPRAMIVASTGLADPAPAPPAAGPTGRFAADRVSVKPDEATIPALERHVLKLDVHLRREAGEAGKPSPPPVALERAVVAVESPVVSAPPGALVRISFWVKIPTPIASTADGLLVFDDAGGEPLSVRLTHAPGWKQYHLYRRVPPTGEIRWTAALTGIGTAYLDDVQIVPLTVRK